PPERAHLDARHRRAAGRIPDGGLPCSGQAGRMTAATWSRADLHLHTTHSDGRHTPQRLATELLRSRLAVVAVTDHDTVAGALEVEERLAGYGPEIVVGTEVSSADGQILALFVDGDVPLGLSAEATVAGIHDRGR